MINVVPTSAIAEDQFCGVCRDRCILRSIATLGHHHCNPCPPDVCPEKGQQPPRCSHIPHIFIGFGCLPNPLHRTSQAKSSTMVDGRWLRSVHGYIPWFPHLCVTTKRTSIQIHDDYVHNNYNCKVPSPPSPSTTPSSQRTPEEAIRSALMSKSLVMTAISDKKYGASGIWWIISTMGPKLLRLVGNN